MALAHSSSVAYQNSSATTSHTAVASVVIPNGAIAFIAVTVTGGATISSITNNTGGQNWTMVGTRMGSTTVQTEIWYWKNTTGASVNTLRTVTLSASKKIATVTTVLTGTNPSVGLISTQEALTATNTASGITLNQTAGSWIISAMGFAGTPTFTNGAGSSYISGAQADSTVATSGGSAATNSRVGFVKTTTNPATARAYNEALGTSSANAIWSTVTVEVQDDNIAVPANVWTTWDEYPTISNVNNVSNIHQRYDTSTTSVFSIVDMAGGDKAARNVITTASNERMASWGQEDTLLFHYGQAAYDEVEMLAKVRTNNLTGYQGSLNVRGSGATSSVQRDLQFQINGQSLNVWEYMSSSSFNSLHNSGPNSGTTGAPAFSYSANQDVWMRVRAIGTAWFFKAWIDGNNEPAGWNMTSADSGRRATQVTSGEWHMFGGYSANSTKDYSYLAIAVNGTTAPGIAPPVSLATVTTQAATAIGQTAATGNGNVTSDGGGAITERGFVWSTSINPTTANSKVVVAGTTGVYFGAMTGLTAGTNYNYRAYAINSAGTSYGANTTFTTSASTTAPSVTSSPVTNITLTGATANGTVGGDGGATITERGIVWGTTASPTTANNKIVVAGTTGALTANITGLANGTNYHYQAYAINSIGTSYGGNISFTTLSPTPPTVVSNDQTLRKGLSFVANGEIADLGSNSVTERGFVYVAGTGTPTTANTKVFTTGTFSTGAYSATITGLTGNTTYTYRAYAISSAGTSYGIDKTLTTKRTVNTIEELDGIRTANVVGGVIRGDFILLRNLDFNADGSYSNPANKPSYTTGLGFVPLGRISPDPWFGANLDGDGHTISNLMVNDSTAGQSNSGLIGVADECIVENLGLIDPLINANATDTAFNQTGALIMGIDAVGTVVVRNCFVKGGRVVGGSGTGLNGTGALLGIAHQYSSGKVDITDCYADGTVVVRNTSGGGSKPGVGGLIGEFTFISGGGSSYLNITNCYSTASVSSPSTSQIGGLIGVVETNVTNTTTSSYWDTQVSGQATSASGTGKTTAELKQQATYNTWNISPASTHTSQVWYINENLDTARLYYEAKTIPYNRDQLGISRVLQVTQAALQGLSRLSKTSDYTITGLGRITVTGSLNQSGIARVLKTVLQTQTGIGRVTASALKTQTGTTRITVTALRTQQGTGWVQVSVDKTQSGQSRLEATVLRTQTGVASIPAQTINTQTGKSAVIRTVDNTIVGLSRITVSIVRSQQGTGRVQVNVVSNQSGQSRVTAVVEQNQQGTASIPGATTKLQTGKSAVLKTTITSIDGISRLEITSSLNQLGASRVTQTTLQTITGLSRLTVTTLRTITGLSTVTVSTLRTQSAIARITVSTLRTVNGLSRIQTTSTSNQTAIARIQKVLVANQLSTSRISNTSLMTTTGLAYLSIDYASTIEGKSRLSKTATSTITGLARIAITSSVSQSGVSRLSTLVQLTQTGIAKINAPTVVDQTLQITGDSAVNNGWADEGGTYTRVQSDDGDTTRLYTPTANSIRTFTHSLTTGLESASISGLTLTAKVRNLNPIDSLNRLVVRIGGTNYFSPNLTNSGSTYVNITYTFTTNPATGLAWTAAQIDSTEVGIQKLDSIGTGLTFFTLVVNAASSDTITAQAQTGLTRVQAVQNSTIVGIGSIAASATASLNGVSRVTINSTKTQTGVASIPASSNRTTTGTADIQKTTSRTIDGLSRVTISSTKSQVGVADILLSVARTLAGISKVEVLSGGAITGKAAVLKSVTRDQNGVTRVSLVLDKAQTGISRLTITLTKPMVGISRIELINAQSQTGNGRIQATALRTINGTARVIVTNLASVTGAARIEITSSGSQTGRGRIETVSLKSQTGVSRINLISNKDQSGIARVTILTQRNVLGQANITATSVVNQTGKSALLKTASSVTSGQSRIETVNTKPLVGQSRLANTYTSDTSGTGIITNIPIQVISGISRISVVVDQTITGNGRVARLETRNQTGTGTIFNGLAKLQTGQSRISKVVTNTTTGRASILATTPKTTTGRANLFRPMSIMRDDFSDNVFDDGKWWRESSATGSTTEANKRIQLTLSAAATEGHFTILENYHQNSMRGESLFFELNEVNLPTGKAFAFHIQINIPNGQNAGFEIRDGNLRVFNDIQSTSIFQTLFTTTFSLVTHKWLKIRESVGTLYFETSPDGITWTQRTTLTPATFPAVDALFAQWGIGHKQAATSGDSHVYMDNINVQTVSNSNTQTGISRLQRVSTAGQLGKAAVLRSIETTQTGVSRLSTAFTKTQTGESRLTIVGTREQTGKADIKATILRQQVGQLVMAGITFKSTTGSSRIARLETTQQRGQAFIVRTVISPAELPNGQYVFDRLPDAANINAATQIPSFNYERGQRNTGNWQEGQDDVIGSWEVT